MVPMLCRKSLQGQENWFVYTHVTEKQQSPALEFRQFESALPVSRCPSGAFCWHCTPGVVGSEERGTVNFQSLCQRSRELGYSRRALWASEHRQRCWQGWSHQVWGPALSRAMRRKDVRTSKQGARGSICTDRSPLLSGPPLPWP